MTWLDRRWFLLMGAALAIAAVVAYCGRTMTDPAVMETPTSTPTIAVTIIPASPTVAVVPTSTRTPVRELIVMTPTTRIPTQTQIPTVVPEPTRTRLPTPTAAVQRG